MQLIWNMEYGVIPEGQRAEGRCEVLFPDGIDIRLDRLIDADPPDVHQPPLQRVERPEHKSPDRERSPTAH